MSEKTKHKVNVRKAHLGDVEKVSKLYKNVWEEFRGLLPDGMIDVGSSSDEVVLAIDKHPMFVAELEDELAGAVYVEHIFDSLKITNLAVANDYRRMGVGSALYEAIETLARENGTGKIWLWTKPQLVHALAFYRAKGFDEEYLLKKHFFGDDQIIMGKVLEI